MQSEVSTKTINIMGDSIEEIDLEMKQKQRKIDILENTIGLPDCEVIEELNRLGLEKTSSKRKK